MSGGSGQGFFGAISAGLHFSVASPPDPAGPSCSHPVPPERGNNGRVSGESSTALGCAASHSKFSSVEMEVAQSGINLSCSVNWVGMRKHHS